MPRPGPDVRFVTRKWPPAVGGMETYGVRLTDELRRFGSVEVIALPGEPSGRRPGAAGMIAWGIGTAFQLLGAAPARVVHAGDLSVWPLAWIASLRHPRSKIILSGHGSDLSLAEGRGWRSRLYAAYLRTGAALLPRARVIANSGYIAGLARRRGFRDVTMVPLGSDLHCTEQAERSKLLYAGRISRAKGLRFLVEEVLPLLPQEIVLRVAGPLWEESEAPLLRHPSVEYLGALSPDALAAQYAEAAAVLIPTRQSEGFGLAAIEAAACGAFVIASRHSGLIDVVQPPIGVTVAADDAQAWADQIRRAFAQSDAQRRTDAESRRAIVEEKYRWSRTAKATWEAYEAN